MVVDCPGCYERKIVAESNGKAYLCKKCYANLMNVLMEIIRPASDPQGPFLTLICKPEEEEAA